jgi:hypothetical protein
MYATKGKIGDVEIKDGRLQLTQSIENENLLLNGWKKNETAAYCIASYAIPSMEYFTPGKYTLAFKGKLGKTTLGTLANGMREHLSLLVQWYDKAGTWEGSWSANIYSNDETIGTSTFEISESRWKEIGHITIGVYQYVKEAEEYPEGAVSWPTSTVYWATCVKGELPRLERQITSVYYDNSSKNRLNLIKPHERTYIKNDVISFSLTEPLIGNEYYTLSVDGELAAGSHFSLYVRTATSDWIWIGEIW